VFVNIFLTYDYELFFGEKTGTIEKCLIEPTNELIRIADKYGVAMTFFVDAGYLVRLDHFSKENEVLKLELETIKKQILELVQKGHAIQLHVHPHWEKSHFESGKWNIETKNAYKLADFSDEEVSRILHTYKHYLDKLIGYPTTVFRAGGWCIQPFDRWKDVFSSLGLMVDTSVFPGGKFISGEYDFDFTSAPRKGRYSFSSDVCAEDLQGEFTEYPISSWNYSPVFYWKLYVLGRLFPHRHKMWGDGDFMKQPGRKRSVLTRFTQNHVSSDGFYAAALLRIAAFYAKNKYSDFVVIGHPKGMTKFGLKALENFIAKKKNIHPFLTFGKAE
jgi:hypothetical protein